MTRRRRQGGLEWRVARREIRRGLPRFLLAALVIALAVGAGTTIDALIRSSQVTAERYAQWTLGDAATARLQWLGTHPAQQTPRADMGLGGGEHATIPEVAALVDEVMPPGSHTLAVRQAAVAIRSGSSLTDGVLGVEGAITDPVLSGVLVSWRGHLPHGPREASISRSLADRLHVTVGDTVEARTDTEAPFSRVRIVGVHENNPLGFEVAFADGTLIPEPETSLAGTTMLWFVDGAEVSWEDVLTSNEAGFVTISRQVVLDPPPSAEVPIYQDGAAYDADIRFGIVILVASVLLVGGTLIILLIGPVFTIGARQSRRDYALLRAQGATSRTIRAIVLRSSAFTGLAASIGGAVTGVVATTIIVCIATRAGSVAFPNLVVPWPDVLGLVVVGTLIALVSAWAPARRAMRDDPVLALRGDIPDAARLVRSRPVLLAGLALGATTAAGLAAATGARTWLLLTGLLGTVVVIAALRPLLSALGTFAIRMPLASRIAVRDAVRRSDRTIPATTGVAAAIAFAVCVATVAATQYATVAADWAPRAGPGTIMIYDGYYVASTGSENPFATSIEQGAGGGESSLTSTVERQRLQEVIGEFVSDPGLVDVRMLSLGGDQYPRILIDPEQTCPEWADYTDHYNRHNGIPAGTGVPASAASQNCWIDKQATDRNFQPSWTSDDGGNIVVDDGTLVRALDLPGAEDAARALHEGKIVLTRDLELWPDGTAHLGIMQEDHDAMAAWEQLLEAGESVYENPPDPIENSTVIAEAIVVDWPSAQWQAFVPESLLSQAPLSENAPIIAHVGLVATGDGLLDAHTFDQLRDRLLILGVHEVTQARGYANDGLATTLTLVTLIAALIAFAATWGTSRLAVADMKPDVHVLHDVGADGRTLRRIITISTVTIGLLGTVTGTCAGILLGSTASAALANDDSIDRGAWSLTIPWLSVATIALVMPFVTAGLAWIHRGYADAAVRRFTVERRGPRPGSA